MRMRLTPRPISHLLVIASLTVIVLAGPASAPARAAEPEALAGSREDHASRRSTLEDPGSTPSARGPSAATGVSATAGSSPGPGHRAKDTADALAALGDLDLPPHAHITISFETTIDPADPGRLVAQNQAEVSSNAVPAQFASVLSGDPDEIAVGDPDDPTQTALDVNVDLVITKSDGLTAAVPGQQIIYTIGATNTGPSGVADAVLTDTLPTALLGCTWTCAGSGGGLCGNDLPSDTGSGSLSEPVDLPVAGSVQVVVTCTLDPAATGTLTNTSTIAPPPPIDDLDLSSNQATDSEPIGQLDLGDAPDPTYPTLIASNGARHVIVPGVRLGGLVDAEPDGQPTADASGDDAAGSSDEDGVSFDSPLVTCTTTGLTVTTSSAGALDAWVDLNRDGSWAQPGEQVLSSEPLAGGTISGLEITIPCSATLGATFARFRFSTAGGLSFDGLALDGEVEDYQVTIVEDADPPTITGVSMGTAGSTAAVDSCDTLRRPVSQLEIVFNEEMRDNGGGADPDDVTNPVNYLLLTEATPGSGFDTSTCGSATGLDQVIPLASITYDPISSAIGIDLNDELGDGVYRILACSTLVDSAGNPLDGGVDHRLDIRIDQDNLLENGHLDYCDSDPAGSPRLGPWQLAGGDPTDLSHSQDDASGSPLSGSARITSSTTASSYRLEQCVPVLAGQVYRLSGRVLLVSPEYLGVTTTCRFFAVPSCGGQALGTRGDSVLLPSTQGGWLPIGARAGLEAPPGSVSASCGFGVSAPSGSLFEAFLDELEMVPEQRVFSDGFESGDTSAWSASAP